MTNEVAVNIAVFKNLSYIVAFVGASHWLGFQPEALSIFVILMIVDVITGIIRSCQVEGCQSIKSSVGIHGVLSKILLLIALFTVALAGKGVAMDMGMFLEGSIAVLILSEEYSILGNIHSARTGKVKQEFDAVAFLLKRIKELLTKALSTK